MLAPRSWRRRAGSGSVALRGECAQESGVGGPHGVPNLLEGGLFAQSDGCGDVTGKGVGASAARPQAPGNGFWSWGASALRFPRAEIWVTRGGAGGVEGPRRWRAAAAGLFFPLGGKDEGW